MGVPPSSASQHSGVPASSIVHRLQSSPVLLFGQTWMDLQIGGRHAFSGTDARHGANQMVARACEMRVADFMTSPWVSHVRGSALFDERMLLCM